MIFDQVIDRKHSESTKWDRYRLQYHDEDLLPLWLADMDFPTSDAIRYALAQRAQHPIYGYTDRGEIYYELFAQRFNQRYNYDIDQSNVVLSTGVMYSISAAIRLFSNRGDKIMVHTPCYHPFIDMIIQNNRNVVMTPLKIRDSIDTFDFEDMESKWDENIKMLILCNPHNPTGRVFTLEELNELALFCERHQIIIVSDEIHCDFTYESTFHTILNISEYTKDHTICCVAPTKSFNLAGIKISAAIIKNPTMLEMFRKEAITSGIASINIFALEALKAAYQHSGNWQCELLKYLKDNRDFACDYIHKNMKDVHFFIPEGTYFLWLDFNDSYIPKTLHEDLITKAHVALSKGSEFERGMSKWARVNFACPRSVLKEALDRICEMIRKG